jgi:hypothetical protein
MTGLLVCLSAAALGVDYGWQPIAGGGIEYVIQIEPQMLEALKRGEDVSSALPAGAQNIRRYRILVGDVTLPHHGEPLPDAGEGTPPAKLQAEVSPVDYEESTESDGGAALIMPLESPYPPDYEHAGIPLPGPALNPPLIARPELTKPRLSPHEKTPEPSDLAQESGETETSAPHQASKPPVETPAEKPSRPSPGKFSLELGPRLSAKAAPAKEPEKREAPVKATHALSQTAEKERPKAKEEPSSPSDHSEPEAKQPATDANSTALVGLFASLGGNVFLLWVASGQRSRYRALLRRSREALSAASLDRLPAPAEHDDGPHWETVTEEEYERETD